MLSLVIDGSLESVWCSQPDPSNESSMTTRAAARYSAIEAALARGCDAAELHHHQGRDPFS
jgi:hypothetical protein